MNLSTFLLHFFVAFPAAFLCSGTTIRSFNSILCLSFHFSLPGRPFALQNCTVSNQSIETIHVECIEGFDGGLPQMFLLEMVEIPTLKLVRNLTLYVSLKIIFPPIFSSIRKSPLFFQTPDLELFSGASRKEKSRILFEFRFDKYLIFTKRTPSL